MSALIATPELIEAAATDLSAIGSTLNTAHLTAAAPTVSVLPAAADEVSAGIAHLFSGYAEDYQKLAGQAATSYEQFVQHLTASASAYASAEAANVASLLQPLTAATAPVAAAATAQNVLADLGWNILFALWEYIPRWLSSFAGPYSVLLFPPLALAISFLTYPITMPLALFLLLFFGLPSGLGPTYPG